MGKGLRSKIKRKFKAIARVKQASIDVEKSKVMHAALLAHLQAAEAGGSAAALAAQVGEPMSADGGDGGDDETRSAAAMSTGEDGARSNRFYKLVREQKANRRKHAQRQALAAAGVKRNAPRSVAKRVLARVARK